MGKSFDVLKEAERIARQATEKPKDRPLEEAERLRYTEELYSDIIATLKRVSRHREQIEMAAIEEKLTDITINAGGVSYNFTIFPQKFARKLDMTNGTEKLKLKIYNLNDKTPISFITYFPQAYEIPSENTLHSYLKGKKMVSDFKRAIGI